MSKFYLRSCFFVVLLFEEVFLVFNPFAPNCHNLLLQGEETESGSDEEEAALGRRRLWQKQCELCFIWQISEAV